MLCRTSNLIFTTLVITINNFYSTTLPASKIQNRLTGVNSKKPVIKIAYLLGCKAHSWVLLCLLPGSWWDSLLLYTFQVIWHMEPGLAHRPSSCSSCRLHAPPCYVAVVQFTGVLAGVSVSKSEVRRNVVFEGFEIKNWLFSFYWFCFFA